MADVENVIIIGSGPAGHTAAVYTARADLKPLMFEGFNAGGIPGGQLMTTTEVENYPGFPDGVTGPEMMMAFKAQSERFGTRCVMQDVQEVDLSQRPFRLKSDGVEYFAKALIIATGASAKYIGLESEQRLMNKGVSAQCNLRWCASNVQRPTPELLWAAAILRWKKHSFWHVLPVR